VLKNRPDLTRAQRERTRDPMNAHARDALVLRFEDLIPSLSLPDPDDRHVLAADIRGRVDSCTRSCARSGPEALSACLHGLSWICASA
jgi:hypothetical protein